MGTSKQWFNQRIGLLRLTDEMVQLVLDGKLTAFREMRRYAAMPPEKQYLAWKADQDQSRSVKPAAEPDSYTAVYSPGPGGPAPSGADKVAGGSATQTDSIPAPREARAAVRTTGHYDDAVATFQHLVAKMSEDVLEKLTDLLVEHRAKRRNG